MGAPIEGSAHSLQTKSNIKSSVSSVAQMSGVNNDCFIHYYIQLKKHLYCLIWDILSYIALELAQWQSDCLQLTQGLR